ncbi:formate dehydrogenase subunit gamma [Calidifontibacillus oryziterrae]|uniref:formate dehydrogenase subunit gamma n=1 Tax=Calidifontibacillus oryziterrae TaxID=1191699 RepID=UPI0002E8B96C|nr:cytochrome b/b6 domain-containing protein [Calidifontibacillus oryziterrae]
MSKKKSKMIRRFGLPFRIAHWLNAFAFFALYITALPMYTEFFDWLYPVLGGPANARLLHRIFAFMFMAPLVFMIVTDPKALFHWIKSALTFRAHDLKFFPAFAKEFFGKHTDIPKQDYYNAGEKVNSLLQMITALCLIGSGIIIWNTGWFPNWLVDIGYPVHAISVGLAVAVVVGHIYLGTLAPGGKEALGGMIKGDVPEEWAKEHHGRWYDEVKEKEDNESKGA